MSDQHKISKADEATAKAASDALIAGAAAARADIPHVYASRERGPTAIETMAGPWAKRAERLVIRGERPGGRPVARELEKQARRRAR
jgi:hypothetical protein